MNLLEQTQIAFDNHQKDLKDHNRAVHESRNPAHVEKALATQAIARDSELVMYTYATWLRSNDKHSLDQLDYNE